MFRKVKTYFQLSKHLRVLVLKAFILTGFYRFVILFVPFRKLASHIGTERYETSKDDLCDIMIVKDIRKAVLIVSKNTPWESKCLVQALTAQRLLKRRKISSTIYMGLAKKEDGQLLAHAWLRVGQWIITGEKEMHAFQPVAWFGYEGK